MMGIEERIGITTVGQDCGRQESAPWIGAERRIRFLLPPGNDFVEKLNHVSVAASRRGNYARRAEGETPSTGANR
jgi:hypothetical protein